MKYHITTTLEKVGEGQRAIIEAGGEISKSEFSIKGVEGRYAFDVSTGVLTVVVDSKPWLASWDTIEDALNNFFA